MIGSPKATQFVGIENGFFPLLWTCLLPEPSPELSVIFRVREGLWSEGGESGWQLRKVDPRSARLLDKCSFCFSKGYWVPNWVPLS